MYVYSLLGVDEFSYLTGGLAIASAIQQDINHFPGLFLSFLRPSVHATALHYTVLHVISAVSNTPFMEDAKEVFKIWVVLPSVFVL